MICASISTVLLRLPFVKDMNNCTCSCSMTIIVIPPPYNMGKRKLKALFMVLYRKNNVILNTFEIHICVVYNEA
jgi:hypothetical protein